MNVLFALLFNVKKTIFCKKTKFKIFNIITKLAAVLNFVFNWGLYLEYDKIEFHPQNRTKNLVCIYEGLERTSRF